ncbi:MAG: NFACT RNA binding domain-containing protein, partial [bacterium]
HEIRRHSARVQKTIKAVERDLQHSRGADEARVKGEILLENLGQVVEKAPSFQTEHEGRRLDIALDPKYTPSENAQRYFKRYKKMKRQRVVAGERKKGMEEESAFLEGLSFDLDEAESAGDLAAIRTALAQGGFVSRRRGSDEKKKRSRKGKRPEEAAPARPWRRFEAPEGWQIFVGKSALGNDALLRQAARDADLWFHAQGMPGSHVLLRMMDGKAVDEAPDEALYQAAALAAYHSSGRGSGRLNVDYLPFRRLRRPRRARPGQVIFTGQRTMAASPDDGANLLDTLEEKE